MPLLADDQDPESLPARVAFHLHRLNISTTALKSAAKLHTNDAVLLRNGQFLLTSTDIRLLCSAFDCPGQELTRALTEQEVLDWAFYRTSARHKLEVWQYADIAAQGAGLSRAAVAKIIGIHRREYFRAVAGSPRAPVFLRPGADKLARSLSLQSAEEFIKGLPRYPIGNNR